PSEALPGFQEECARLRRVVRVGRLEAASSLRREPWASVRPIEGGVLRAGPLRAGALRDGPVESKVRASEEPLSQILLKQLCQEARRLGRIDGLRQLVVVDEAHNIAPRDPEYQSFLEMIAIENRKYGQGLVVATTSPSQLSEALLRNASIRYCHLLDDGKDIDLMLRFMVNRLEIDRYLADVRMLGLGEALVQVSAPRSVPPTRVAVQFDEPKKP